MEDMGDLLVSWVVRWRGGQQSLLECRCGVVLLLLMGAGRERRELVECRDLQGLGWRKTRSCGWAVAGGRGPGLVREQLGV